MDIANGLRKARRFVASLGLVTMLLSMVVTNTASAYYSDVPADAWYKPYVDELLADGTLDPSQPTFRAGDNLSRAEAAAALVRMAGFTVTTPATPSFKDAGYEPGKWYYQWIETAVANGVMSGYKTASGQPTGYVGYADNVTRGQFAIMIVNAMSLAKKADVVPTWSDLSTNHYAYEAMVTAYNWSILKGDDGMNTVRPDASINRAEAMAMMARAKNPTPVEKPEMAFNVQMATATAKDMVEVTFSQDVEEKTGSVASNYMIEDESGTELAVTKAVVSADKVTLTTATQTENKPYTLMVSGVKSASGADLDQTDADFKGYTTTPTSMGDLNVTLNEKTPAAASAPKGASGVVFSCFDFAAKSDAVTVQSLTVHRTGAGDEQDFSDVYLYNGAQRLTTGRTINSETQMVEFNNINVNIVAGGVATLCVVGDFSLTADAAGQHAFEIVNMSAITTNAKNVTGTFPVKGNAMTVAGGTVGSASISANGSLDEVTIGEQAARIAQFEIEASGQEDQELQRIALYIRGSIRPTDLGKLKLSAEGGTEVLATADTVADNSLATFVLDKPYVIGRGQRKIFYVTADVRGRNGDDIKVYLDETTDILLVGKTFGYGVRVDNTNAAGNPGYDGATANDGTKGFSSVVIKGSEFNIAFAGPTAGDVAAGQIAAHCMDMTITNASQNDVEIKNWEVVLNIENTPTQAGGLFNGTTGNPNFTLIKLVTLTDDGKVDKTLLGPKELNATAGDQTQTVVLSGSGSIPKNTSVKAAIIFNVASTAVNGDKINCRLKDVTQIADAVRDSNGDALGANSVTPATDITGNTMTVSTAALTFDMASTPSSRTYVRGTSNADLAAFTVRSGSSLSNTVKNLSIQGYIDCDTAGVFATGTASITAHCTTENAGSALKDVVDNLELYMGNTLVSKVENIDLATGKIIFNNLNIAVPKSTTVTLTLRGHINNSAPYGNLNDRVKFGIASQTDVTAIDSNGQTVAQTSMNIGTAGSQAQNGGTADSGIIMLISQGGQGTVTNSAGTESKARLLAGQQEQVVGRWKFDAQDEDVTLKDLTFGAFDTNAMTRVKFYDSATNTVLGDPNGYTVESTGVVLVKDINVTVKDTTPLTIEGRAITSSVGPGGAQSGDNVGLVLLSVDEVSSASGKNIAEKFAGVQPSTRDLDVALVGDVARYTVQPIDVGGTDGDLLPAIGNVIIIDQEQMVVTNSTGTTGQVMRGVTLFPSTLTAPAHAAGALYYVSTLANSPAQNSANHMAIPTGANITAADTFLCYDVTSNLNVTVAADPSDPFKAGDVVLVGAGANAEYMLVTAVNVNEAVTPHCWGLNNTTNGELTVVRGLYGTTPVIHGGLDTITRFSQHGEISRLRKTKPSFTLLPVNPAATLPDPTTRVLRFSITATGADQVVIDGNQNDGIIALVDVTNASANNVVSPATGTEDLAGSCQLRNADNTGIVYQRGDIEGLQLDPEWTGANNFTADPDTNGGVTESGNVVIFARVGVKSGTQKLIVQAGQTVNLEIACNTSGLTTGNGGDKSTFNLRIPQTFTYGTATGLGTVIYHDGTEAGHIDSDTLLMDGLPLNGPTVTN